MCGGSSVAASINPSVRPLRAHRLCLRAWQRLWGSLCVFACVFVRTFVRVRRSVCARAFVSLHAGSCEFLCVRLGVGDAFLSGSIVARVSVLNMCVCGSAVCVPRFCMRAGVGPPGNMIARPSGTGRPRARLRFGANRL